MPAADATDALGRSQFTDINFYMTDDVLVKVDRMSMAHALEVRSPLLDHRIIEFAARLPARLKINSTQGKFCSAGLPKDVCPPIFSISRSAAFRSRRLNGSGPN